MTSFLRAIGLWRDDDDEVMTPAEKEKLQREIDKARQESEKFSEDRKPCWLFEKLAEPSVRNIYLIVIHREIWEQAGTIGDVRQTNLLFDEKTAEKYIFKTQYLNEMLKKKADAQKAQQSQSSLVECNELLFVYAYFKNQAQDELNIDNEAYQGDVQFTEGYGNRLMRPLDKNCDVHAVFPVKLNTANNRIAFPSPDRVLTDMARCATQYGIKTDKTKWRP